MNEGLIARRYAKALLKYAQEKDKTFPVYEAARQVEASFIAHLESCAHCQSEGGVNALCCRCRCRFFGRIPSFCPAASERAQRGLFTPYYAYVSEVVSGRQSYCQSPNRNGCSSRQTNPFSYRRGRCPSLQRCKAGI